MKAMRSVSGRGLVALPAEIYPPERIAEFDAGETALSSAMKAAKHSAERIAKEGRKYGISLTVISQRPREVSATILSQCNSFLCLRISNPDDQSYVRNLLPDSVRGIASMFSMLRRGESILIGDSVMMPTRIKIDAPNPAPESDDASFYKAWNEAPKEVDFAKVVQAWRNQEIVP